MSDEETKTTKEPSEGNVIDGVRFPVQATHWGCYRITGFGKDDRERLSFGESGTGEAVLEWPVSEYSTRTLYERWGPGTYRISFGSWDDANHRRSYGRSKEIKLDTPIVAKPPPPPAPVGPRMCTDCGQPLAVGARFCASCGAPAGGAPRAAAPETPPAFLAGFEVAMKMIGSANAIASAEISERASRLRQEHEQEMQRQRQRFEAEMKDRDHAHAERVRRMTETAGNADVVTTVREAVGEAVLSLQEEIEELRAGADEADGVHKIAATVRAISGVVKEVAPVMGPILVSAFEKMAASAKAAAPAAAAAGVNGAA